MIFSKKKLVQSWYGFVPVFLYSKNFWNYLDLPITQFSGPGFKLQSVKLGHWAEGPALIVD